jgi:hypothetical protein
MELAAIAGLLGVGYMLTRTSEQTEGFSTAEETMDWDEGPGVPPPLYPTDKLAPGQPTMSSPGKPRQPLRQGDSQLDLYYNLPSGGSLPSNPATDPDLYPRSIVFSSPAPPKQAPQTAITAQVQMRTDGVEQMPVYNSGKTVISALTGLPIQAEDFTHNNMVPFYRGSLKQNMADTGNRQTLDNYAGTGFDQISKREQAPLFDPHREPTGNINGMESITSFVQDRILAPTSRAGERPVEPTMVGPGLGEGFSSIPKGGFQQFETNEIARQRLSIDELRAESNPKISYEGVVVPGKALATQRGDLGEIRKYRPDTFFLNENGERNFVTSTGDSLKPTERATEVMKYQSRIETTSEFMGPAASADFTATYTVPSFRAPLARQQEGFGMRNADGSNYGVANTDAPNNDFGASSYEFLTNQRNVTSERGQALNLVEAGAPKALTVYDPSDVTRATIRESTGANDFIGISSPAGAAQKLTVYDPNDVARTTFRELSGQTDYVGVSSPDGGAQKLTVYDPTDIMRVTARNVMAEPDKAMNVTRAGMPGLATLQFPDGMRKTTKEQISSGYGGVAGAANAKAEQVYDTAYNMRQYPTKEILSARRKPIAGNGNIAIFNGEDYINQSYRKPMTDALNDRVNTSDRVVGMPLGKESQGLQRPRNILQLDVSRDRNIHDILDTLDDNPYAMPVHKIALGGSAF